MNLNNFELKSNKIHISEKKLTFEFHKLNKFMLDFFYLLYMMLNNAIAAVTLQ